MPFKQLIDEHNAVEVGDPSIGQWDKARERRIDAGVTRNQAALSRLLGGRPDHPYNAMKWDQAAISIEEARLLGGIDSDYAIGDQTVEKILGPRTNSIAWQTAAEIIEKALEPDIEPIEIEAPQQTRSRSIRR